MICPQNKNENFDEIKCRNCKYYLVCYKLINNGNLWQKNNPTNEEKLIINSLAQEIRDYGEERVWENINTIKLEDRLNYIEFFFSAKRLLKVGEY